MKIVYIVRHAKSSWEDPALDDFDRPLNERGLRDAPRMGRRLKERDISPGLLLSSPATRALSTPVLMAAPIGYQPEQIKTDPALYHASADEMLKVVQSLDNKVDAAMIFGHNPGLTDFVNSLCETDPHIFNVPTCGVAAFSFSSDSWRNVQFGKGKLLFYDYPKSKKD